MYIMLAAVALKKVLGMIIRRAAVGSTKKCTSSPTLSQCQNPNYKANLLNPVEDPQRLAQEVKDL